MTVERRLILGLFLCSLLGCGAKGPKPEVLVPASGSVNLNGRPAEGVRMTFHPTEGTKAVGGCWAKTDSQGKYTVMHVTNKPGIPVGTYFVTFSQFVKPDGKPLGDNESPTMTQCTQAISPRWNDITKAGMHNTAVVPEKGSSSLDFNISTSPKNSAKK